MQPVNLEYSREFWIRIAIVGGIIGVISLLVLSISKGRLILIAIAVVPPVFYMTMMLLTHIRAVKIIDSEGVTRRDNKRLPWSEFKRRRDVHVVSKFGVTGALNNIELYFAQGKANIFPHVINDAGDVLAAIDQYAKPPVYRNDCSICTQLRDEEWAMQKHGREEDDTNLPGAAWQLKDVRELKPGTTRSPILKECPQCGTFYVYKESYDYLATGSEDEQRLTRFGSEAEAVASIN